MSANVTLITLLCVLALAAAAFRVIAGPVAELGDGGSLYARAKFGSDPSWAQPPVEIAVSDARPASR